MHKELVEELEDSFWLKKALHIFVKFPCYNFLKLHHFLPLCVEVYAVRSSKKNDLFLPWCIFLRVSFRKDPKVSKSKICRIIIPRKLSVRKLQISWESIGPLSRAISENLYNNLKQSLKHFLKPSVAFPTSPWYKPQSNW